MSDEAAPGFDRWVSVAEIGTGGLRRRLEASPAELAALARRYRVPEVVTLTADVALHRRGGGYRLEGRIKARVVQHCVVTLDDLASDVDESFTVDFAPADAPEPAAGEIDIDAEADDPPEPVVNGRIPVGEMVAQHLALAIPPYPRAPDAELERRTAGDDGDERQSPFAILRKLG